MFTVVLTAPHVCAGFDGERVAASQLDDVRQLLGSRHRRGRLQGAG